MTTTTRNLVIWMATLAFATFAIPPLRLFWSHLTLNGHTFSTSLIWLHYGYLLIWLFEFLWSFVVGVALARALRSNYTLSVASSLGIAAGLLHFLRSRNYINPEAHWSTYVWVYGEYFVPAIGAAIGAAVTRWLWPSRPSIMKKLR